MTGQLVMIYSSVLAIVTVAGGVLRYVIEHVRRLFGLYFRGPKIFQCPEVGLQPARRRLFLAALSGGALRREIAFERSPEDAWLQRRLRPEVRSEKMAGFAPLRVGPVIACCEKEMWRAVVRFTAGLLLLPSFVVCVFVCFPFASARSCGVQVPGRTPLGQ